MKITIAVADRQPLILQALAQLLLQDPDIHMAYSCLNDNDLAQRLAAEPVDMVIAEDIFLLREQHRDDKPVLKPYMQQGKLIVTTDFPQAFVLNSLIDMDVGMLISKQDPPQEMLEGLRCAKTSSGGRYFSSTVYAVLEQLTLNKINGQDLTKKELEIIQLLASGLSLVQIAKLKNRSISTVATHKYNAMRKLGISSNADLIRYAVDSHIL
ncbi:MULTISPECIES: helix-turn-helix transcriptional regulator [Enterobacter]|uniref:helix-turn-helix transcriptional regulator n=1 Tax=Enterobacter TaxID=547 RepID=UPI001F2AD34D|nr:response regulator transcription factor [Enterobacter quasiroggenkampii]